MTTTIALRDYQTEALERVAKAEARGVRKQLGVAATGLGKTIMFCALARERECRTLILAHRDELVSQAVAKVREVWPDAQVGIVKATENDVNARVVVASVQTLARQRRLDMLVCSQWGDTAGMSGWGLTTPEPFGLVIVDEAHHTAADSYRRILDGLDAGTPEGPLLLGVTATPDRGDGKGLDDLFDEIVFNYDLLWGIRSGYLCDVRALRVKLTALDMSTVKVSKGDYEAGAAGRAMEQANAPEAIYRQWKEYASDRRTIVFVPTVALSEETAAVFGENGVECAHVSASTPLDERRSILRGYAEGTIQVVTNCMVLTEGFDSPRTDCIIAARPTKNRALFTQMIGRGTRKHPDKHDLLVLDVVGNSDELSLITVPSLFGIEKPQFAKALGDGTKNLTDVVEEHDKWLVKAGKITAEQADLFKKIRADGVAWVRIDNGEYRRPLGYKDRDGKWKDLPTIALRDCSLNGQVGQDWKCIAVDPQSGVERVLIAGVDLSLATGVGEDAVRKLMGNRAHYVNTGASWRKREPSERQIEAARKWRLPNVEQYKTAGELSDALDQHIERKKSKRGA